jgi:hypothetical protein
MYLDWWVSTSLIMWIRLVTRTIDLLTGSNFAPHASYKQHCHSFILITIIGRSDAPRRCRGAFISTFCSGVSMLLSTRDDTESEKFCSCICMLRLYSSKIAPFPHTQWTIQSAKSNACIRYTSSHPPGLCPVCSGRQYSLPGIWFIFFQFHRVCVSQNTHILSCTPLVKSYRAV